MATEWMPLTRFEPKQWLLANGEIIKEPPLEQTATGRKVRVVGSKASFFQGNLDQALWEAAEAVAQEKNTKVVMEVLSPSDQKARVRSSLGIDLQSVSAARLHTVHQPGEQGASTLAWWTFKSSTLPIEATVVATVTSGAVWNQPARQVVSTRMTFQSMDRRYNIGDPVQILSDTNQHQQFVEYLPDELIGPWREFLRDERPEWDDSILASSYAVNTPQSAVKALLSVVQHMESLEKIQVPNFLDLENPSWMDLELYQTNVNAEFVSDLTEWLDSNPMIDGILDAYQALVTQLANAGFNVSDKSGNDFIAALLSGNKATMNMQVENVLNPLTHGYDAHHKVSLHLPSGTIVVQCDHEAMDLDGISDQWDAAMAVARLSGEEDVLVEYARKVAADRNAKAAKELIKSRQ